jgi:hypothetical protein
MRIVCVCAFVVIGGVGCACWGPAPVPSHDQAVASDDDDDTHVTFPLVRPLDGTLLVTPVEVGSDWYLFELDPFAPRTRIDGDVVTHGSDDETARITLTAGGATQLIDAELFDAGTIPRDNFDIMGVIGRDVLRDDLVFGVDRDAGVAWLASRKKFRPQRTVRPVPYLSSDGGAQVIGEIDGKPHYLRVDLEDPEARLRGAPDATLADVRAFGLDRPRLALGDYRAHDAEGVLGEAFFAPYDVAIDRTNVQLYLSQRGRDTTAATRIARWGATPCTHLGCVEVSVEPGAGSAQPRLYVHREDAATKIALEVSLVAIGLPDAPRLRVGLPADVHGWHVPIDPRYAGHTLVVADMSPFPRPCAAASGSDCVYLEQVER